MPAEMLRVGPGEIRRGDRTLRGGTQVEVIDMVVAGLTGKMLRFDNGSIYLLRSGDELQVCRGAQATAPARRATHPRRTAGNTAAAEEGHTAREVAERAERHSQAAIAMWARRRERFAAASEQGLQRGPYPGEEHMRHCGYRMWPKPVHGGGLLYTCNRCGHIKADQAPDEAPQ
ncbi:hypothetical protein [Streptomyces nanshensis]|uniref:Uncharacterized protein n=1 Tax=Streptomyces nanshensis TaxID=518642 RepID=A0A1E7LAE0_9ACTN|nr:hypothetical protein [Streptomyces nanshensis]OEV13159.1 hypothetical protein AN218_04955 [Streptomyces nanshensis]